MASTRNFRISYWGPALLVLGLSFWLRTESSQLRQFHADEGVQAYQAWRLIEEGTYRYDPQEHHGPFLYFVTDWLYPLIDDSDGELTDSGARSVPILFSLLTLLIGFWAFRGASPVAGLLWGLIVATAPLCVIYGSYYVQEAILGCFTLGFAIAVYRYANEPRQLFLAATAIFLGLMHVTKETAVIHVFSVAVGLVFCFATGRGRKTSLGGRLWGHAFVALGIVGALHVLFFSSFFENPAGVWDGVKSYFNYANRAGGQGHEKGFSYYIELFLPQTREGIRWSELAFLMLALLAFGRAFVRKTDSLAVYLSVVAFVMLIVYSAIPYKTPWLIYSFYLLVAYPVGRLAVDCANAAQAFERKRRMAALASLAIVISWWGISVFKNVRYGVFRYASDARNPYLYVHTTPRYAALVERLESLGTDVAIEVYSPDGAWPLPWHLRGREKVGFWATMDEIEIGDRSVLIIDTRLLQDQVNLLQDGGFWELHGLRPNTLLALRAPDTVAKKWIRE